MLNLDAQKITGQVILPRIHLCLAGRLFSILLFCVAVDICCVPRKLILVETTNLTSVLSHRRT